MIYSIDKENLTDLQAHYGNRGNHLRWPSPFMLPGWLEAWWLSFGAGYEQLILTICEDGDVIGIAPLKVEHGTASIIGDNSVCDYLDFITVPGKEDAFAKALLEYLPVHGVKSLILETLKPGSVAGHNVVNQAELLGKTSTCAPIEVSSEMELPATWEEYLASLESRQRRDVERKMRQLENVAEVRFTVLRDSEVGETDLSLFFSMMTDSRRDKAQFLTPEMRYYFESLVHSMSDYGVLRLGFLSVGVVKVAAILYFEYNDRIYLYNSGYMPQYAGMNVGLVSKLYCIRQSIENGKKVFDFLKGPEVYKSRLGGREISLSRCDMSLA